jgi:hypothetical protein
MQAGKHERSEPISETPEQRFLQEDEGAGYIPKAVPN